MKAVYLVCLNVNFGTSISESAFPSATKAVAFFTGVFFDLKEDGYKDSGILPTKTPYIRMKKFEKPSTTINGATDTAVLSIRRVAFFV